EIASQITKDFENEELLCIAVLRGAVLWFSDLVEKIDLPIKFDFIRVSSYKGEESSGKLKIHQDTYLDMKNKNVLVIEDIVDTGLTLSHISNEFSNKGAKCIKTCALLDKKDRRQVPFVADYVGFEIPDVFVVGYGMDFNDKYRGLNYVASLN
ncbi:MAG: hypoxanthine phosphoribosyltransferase, partial [Clostridiales Family XIII bacterium]|nr:hypoxanthine phosphoribosyltransferase [Clostridiales Family XIII bacterium]